MRPAGPQANATRVPSTQRLLHTLVAPVGRPLNYKKGRGLEMGEGLGPKRRRSEDASLPKKERVRIPRSNRNQGRWLLMTTLQRPRVADQSWFEEFDELERQGFVWHFDRHDWEPAHGRACICCGADMDFRCFELQDIAYRAYALCVMCGWWMEF